LALIEDFRDPKISKRRYFVLIEFAVSNFRSIKEQQVFSLLATAEKSNSSNKIQLKNYKKMGVLNSAVIFGANGSGKSNLIKGLEYFIEFVRASDQFGPNKKISFYHPYKLDEASKKSPTEFEIEFLDKEGIRFNYSVAFNSEEITSEKLHYYPRVKEIKVFERRKGEEIEFGDLAGPKKKIESLLGKNQLFLTKAAKSENKFIANIYKNLIRNFEIINSNDQYFGPGSQRTTAYIRKSDENKDIIKALLQAADISIEDIKVKKVQVDESRYSFFLDDMPSDVKDSFIEGMSYEPKLIHATFDENGNKNGVTEFSLNEESDGTVKLFQLAARIIRALDYGETLLIDEINNGLHPVLGHFIVSLFQNKEVNTNNAQIIFTTHDVNFMEQRLFRRDQIWFIEKDKQGKTSIYSLSEFGNNKSLIRKNVSIRNWYLSGRFGAVPVIRDLLLKRRGNGKS
jgi:AAA15 family ATPase/GTPase